MNLSRKLRYDKDGRSTTRDEQTARLIQDTAIVLLTVAPRKSVFW